MKVVLLFIMVMHGLIHLTVFSKEWNLPRVERLSGATIIALSKPAARISGICWLAVCMLFLFAAIILLINKAWWWIPALVAIAISQALIIVYWKEARWGTFVNLLLLAAAVYAYADWKFNKMAMSEAQEIFAKVNQTNIPVITAGMLDGLPVPVQGWLSKSGIIGKEKIISVRLKQKGWMRTKPGQGKWIESQAVEYITLDEPAFVWAVDMNMMPVIPVTGRDKFIDGKGQMTIKAFSMFNMVDQADEKINQGALQRYLAEMPGFPSGALSPYIKWYAIDAASARATMTYQGVSGSVIFHFNAAGDVAVCTADRYQGGGKDATLEHWEGRSIEFGAYNGIRIPVKSAITWKLKTGDFTWYRQEITELEYNKPVLYE